MAAYDSFERLRHSLDLSLNTPMLMLSAYFDESYNQPTSKDPDAPLVYTVAGYLASVNQWRGYNREWKKALASMGLSSFHMAEFESRIGPYANWSND